MSDEKKLPKRRFKEFLNTPSWEQRKLGQCSVIITGGTPSTRILEYWSPKEIPWMSSGEINKKRISKTDDKISKLGLEQSSARWVKKNSILIALAGQGKTRGTVAINGIDLTTNQSIAAIELDSVFNTEFVFQNLDSRYDELRKESSGDGTRGGLNKKIISDLYIPYTEYKEQDSIGDFFKKLDNLITLHQRKLNKLENLKKAYLEELFPDGKQCKPKRRFKEFKDDWEQRKLTDISKTFIGLVTTMTTNYREAGTLLIRNSDIRDNKFIFSEKPIYLDSEFAKSNESRKLKSGDVVTVHTGDIGTSAVVEEDIEGAIGFATINTRPDINYLDPHFLSTYFNTERHKKYAISVATGDGRSNYNIKDFNKLMLYMPSINEQKAIAEFIKRITDLITLHQRKLEHLQLQKKALLQQMFV